MEEADANALGRTQSNSTQAVDGLKVDLGV
jgi:hypothetical protein